MVINNNGPVRACVTEPDILPAGSNNCRSSDLDKFFLKNVTLIYNNFSGSIIL